MKTLKSMVDQLFVAIRRAHIAIDFQLYCAVVRPLPPLPCKKTSPVKGK